MYGRASDKRFHLVDLPGHGYAKFSKHEREKLSGKIIEYIRGREELSLVILLNDSRRMPEEDELSIRDEAFEAGRHFLVVLTKIDKLKRNEIKKQVSSIAEAYGLEPQDLLLSGMGEDPEGLWRRILGLL